MTRRIGKGWRFPAIWILTLLLTASSTLAVTHGTLVANDGYDIYDYELKALIDQYIPTYGSMILAFTECYGGDKMDDFAGKPNTAVLSGSTPGNTTEYGGYHRGLAKNLKPGSTTDAAHAAADAAKKPGDTPTKAGSNENIGIGGPITSTHVLVWAGDPNAQDQADINDIKTNFPAGPNQTVTVLSGAGGPGTDGAANYANLKNTMKNIGAMMNPNEQFVLFVTDHGDIDHGTTASVAPFSFLPVPINILPDVVNDIHNDPNNKAALSFTSDIHIAPNLMSLQMIAVNSQIIYQFGVDSFFDVFTELSINLDEDPAFEKYHYVTKPGILNESHLSPFNQVFLNNNASPNPLNVFVSIDSGAISRITGPTVLGDLNNDGLVNNQDIAPFVLALTDQAAWEAEYPGVNLLDVGDINGDATFNNQDIAPFVTLLTGGPIMTTTDPNSVPEPATLGLLAVGGLLMLRRCKR